MISPEVTQVQLTDFWITTLDFCLVSASALTHFNTTDNLAANDTLFKPTQYIRPSMEAL